MTAAAVAASGGEIPVAMVLVSHSVDLARGAADLAGQMAPLVHIVPAGGVDDGGLGTSFDKVSAALAKAADRARSVVVLADLGSARLTVECVLDFDADLAARVRLVDAPFVEGAVAAAVTAAGGSGLDDVAAAAAHAGTLFAGSGGLVAPVVPDGAGLGPGAAGAPAARCGPAQAAASGRTRVLTLRNKLGLHARPAAMLARAIAGFDATVTVNGVNGASVLELMKLGVVGGATITVAASGNQATEALEAIARMVEDAFGEE